MEKISPNGIKKQLTGYRRDDIGFVFQFYNLVPNLTATENVELALQISKNPLKAEEVLKDVGLGHRLNNFPAAVIWWGTAESFYCTCIGKESKDLAL